MKVRKNALATIHHVLMCLLVLSVNGWYWYIMLTNWPE